METAGRMHALRRAAVVAGGSDVVAVVLRIDPDGFGPVWVAQAVGEKLHSVTEMGATADSALDALTARLVTVLKDERRLAHERREACDAAIAVLGGGYEVVSKPGAAITVEQKRLSPEELARLDGGPGLAAALRGGR